MVKGFLFLFFNKTLQCQIIDKCLQRKAILIHHMLMSVLFSNSIMIYITCDPSSCSTYRFKACLYFWNCQSSTMVTNW